VLFSRPWVKCYAFGGMKRRRRKKELGWYYVGRLFSIGTVLRPRQPQAVAYYIILRTQWEGYDRGWQLSLGCNTVLSQVIHFFAKTGRCLRLDGARSLKWVPLMPPVNIVAEVWVLGVFNNAAEGLLITILKGSDGDQTSRHALGGEVLDT